MLEDHKIAEARCFTVVHVFLVLIIAGTAISENSLDTDKEILLNLKSFLEEGNRINRGRYEEWNQISSNPCDWDGIFCSSDGARVTGIDLSDNRINGEMFKNFSALGKLQYLDLSKNTLTGTIPDDLNGCHNLVHLNLSHNILEGELNLVGLTSLEKLDLSTNRFRGDMQFSLPANCNKLVVANLSTNNLTGRIDNCFDGCRNLQYLDLSANMFTGYIWTGFSRLVEFSVSENNITGQVSASIFVNCSLLALDLSENKFQGEVPWEISNCNNLAVLNLWGNNFTGPIPAQIGSILTLEGLLLGGNSFSRVIPESLLNLKNLALLDLSRNNFGGEIQDIFGRFTQLKSLVLQGNSYTGGIYSSGIHRLPNIYRLDLSYNNFFGFLPVEISQMLSLKFLILAYNQFKGTIPPEYGNLSQLQALDLSFNDLSGSIPRALGNLSSLLWLMLANNSLTGEIPHEIGNCDSLLWINLANNQLSGAIPHELTNIGRNASPVFESNRQSDLMIAGPSECLVTERLLTVDYSPFGFLYTIPTRKICRSIWNQLLKGYGFFPVCTLGSSVRTYQISGYIQLSGNQLTGELPPDIDKMQNFSVLDLGSNEFYGKLPTEIGKLPLVVLNISGNRFSGQIPKEIGNIKCLRNLDLSRNNFSGTFPRNLNELHELSKFNISFNPLLAGNIPGPGQLSTFEKESFLGNPLLHSPYFRLDNQLPPPPPSNENEFWMNRGGFESENEFRMDEDSLNSENILRWEALLTGYGCGIVFGVAMLYITFRKGEPNWFDAMLDGIHQWRAKRLLKRNAPRRGD